jgi:anti-sigma factor RsiW
MKHEAARRLLSAYADRQLGPVRRFRLARHLAQCPSCLGQLEAMHAVRSVVRTNLTVHRAPPALAMRIGSALAREAPPVAGRRPLRYGFAGAALAGSLAGVALTLAVTRLAPEPDRLAADAVADHVRSLMADHLLDVPTSDRHTVKPWLSGRLDLSPVVKDLTAEGYPLVGGRLDYIGGHRAAAVVYRRDTHVINLFAFVSDERSDLLPREQSLDGFNVIRWRMGGLCYVAVSDVEASQLRRFVELVETSG